MSRGEHQPRHTDVLKDDRAKDALSRLEHGIDSILNGEQYAAYLRSLASFHSYSFGNVMLIHIQRPDATQVAGFKRWQELGRQVKKGEKGIKILVPYTHWVNRNDEEQGGEHQETVPADRQRAVRGFGVGTVFDVSQTEGPPLPQPPSAELIDGASDPGMRLFADLIDYLAEQGIPVEREELAYANGSFDPQARTIAIGRHIDGDQATKTLAHEAAHAIAGHTFDMTSQDVETVAESTAFVVLTHYRIDSSGYSFAYISRWARDTAVFKRNLAAIQETSHAIIAGLEGNETLSIPHRSRTPASTAPQVIFEA